VVWESRLVLAALEALPHDEQLALTVIGRLARLHAVRLERTCAKDRAGGAERTG
jgi:hypothetical protein